MSNINDRDDARKTAEKVLQRDRKRIRRLAGVTIGLWLLAALLIPSVYLPLGARVNQSVKIIDADNPGTAMALRANKPPHTAPLTPDQIPNAVAKLQDHQWLMVQIIAHQWIIGGIILMLAMGAAILASASTVALAFTIRRATLRQISENLAEISEQLRQLQRGSGGLQ